MVEREPRSNLFFTGVGAEAGAKFCRSRTRSWSQTILELFQLRICSKLKTGTCSLRCLSRMSRQLLHYPCIACFAECVYAVSTRKLDHFPGKPHGYSLRSLTSAYWPSVDFSDVAALSNSNIQRTVFNQILLKTETNRQQNII